MRLSFIQALRLTSVKRDRRLVLTFFKCENDCSHAYVEPNMVNTTKHTLQCVVCDKGGGRSAPPNTNESNICERHLAAKGDLTAKYYWNRPPLNLRAGSAPGMWQEARSKFWQPTGLQVEGFSFLSTCACSQALLAVVQVFPNLHAVTWTCSPASEATSQQLLTQNLWWKHQGCNSSRLRPHHIHVDEWWT